MTDNELKAWLMAYKDGDKIPDNMGYRVIRLLQILLAPPKKGRPPISQKDINSMRKGIKAAL